MSKVFLSLSLIQLTRFSLQLYPTASSVCNTLVDIAFLVDSSASVTKFNYIKMKRFIAEMTSRFNFFPTKTRVAVILFGSDAKTEIDFESYGSFDAFRDAVLRLPHYEGRFQLTI